MAASMALQVVVSPFLGVLFDNITSPVYKELGLLWGVDSELKKLTSTVSALQSVLADAEEKQLTSKVIADWLLKLKYAAYDADDILDEWETESRGTQEEHTTQVCRSLLSCFSLEQIKFRHKIAKLMKELNQRFADIAAERSMFDLREGVAVRRGVDPYANRMTGSIPTESNIYGRDEDKAYIIEWLLNNANGTQDLSICSILGIGGLGKTTLAQAVFNDDKVKEHFNVNIWVCVSNDFDLIKLTRAVLDSIPGSSCNSKQLDPLQRSLQKRLSGKRFLLVLDDVWNESQEEWDRFKSSLVCGNKGSSILVTTRLKTVASITGTCPHYPLKLLSEDDCWALFKQRAFGDGNEEKSNLVKLGKEIVQKCGGVPLAAKVLGALLRFKAKESEWLYVRDNKILDLPQSSDNTILPALKLSYNHLSPHLRQCFAYCSIFPQDFCIKKEDIVHLWMANGLLQDREGMRMEDTGDEIVESLVWRSLFQVAERDEEGNLEEAFVMHDLVNDLACSVARNECCHVGWRRQNVNVLNGIRHLFVRFNTKPSLTMFQMIHQFAPKIRTLLCNVDDGFGTELSLLDVLPTFTCLRALKVNNIETEIPESIGNLKHLRYLDLSHGKYKYLPESICGLRNLQTLKLNCCFDLEALPKSLSNLRSLRHLGIRGCWKLSEMPMDMGKMTCLQTLVLFIVGSSKGQYITEIEMMYNLLGELTIKCLEKVRSRRDAECANLIRKKRLETLKLEWSDLHTGQENEREVIEGLRPNSNLKRLYIKNYQGIGFPSWLEYSILPNLVEIGLIGCTRCEALPPSLGRLPFLKLLEVREMPLVKTLFSVGDIDSDDVVYMFPSLEILWLGNMPELEEWCSFTGNNGVREQMFLLPCLKELGICNIPKLTRVPFSPSLETLMLMKCNEMVLGLLRNLSCLSSLEIEELDEVVCFPEGSLQNLTALESLCIKRLKKLEVLPRESLGRLVKFEVLKCDELVSLPQVGSSCLRELDILCCPSLTDLRGVVNGCQTTLRELHIADCPKLEWSSLEFKHLIAIETLSISDFPEMMSLPDGIQHLSSTLQKLHLLHLDSLSSLPQWTGTLTQLQFLQISSCRKLTMLPNGLRHTNLQTLFITRCHPDLHRRYENRQGEDCRSIPHLRTIINCTDYPYNLISFHLFFFFCFLSKSSSFQNFPFLLLFLFSLFNYLVSLIITTKVRFSFSKTVTYILTGSD